MVMTGDNYGIVLATLYNGFLWSNDDRIDMIMKSNKLLELEGSVGLAQWDDGLKRNGSYDSYPNWQYAVFGLIQGKPDRNQSAVWVHNWLNHVIPLFGMTTNDPQRVMAFKMGF